MADIIQKASYELVVEGTTYSMVAVPEASSALVTKQKDRVLRNLKLDKLISNLMRAGELLFLAYNGVAGYGELRASVTKISDNLGVLTADCEATMHAFERSAKSILGNLRDCFKFLLQGKEEWAITWLGKAGTAATEMATKADGLAVRFDELGNTAVETLGKTQIAQGQAEETREKVKQDMADLEAKTAGAKRLAAELLEIKPNLQRLYEEAKAKAETAENRGFALSIVNAVMKPLGEGLGAFAGAMTRAQSPTGMMSMMPPMVGPYSTPPGAGYGPSPTQPPGGAYVPPPTQPPGAPPPVSRSPGAGPPPGPGTPPPTQPPGGAPPGVSRPPGATTPPRSAAAPSGIDPAAVAGAAVAGAALSNAGASAGQMGSDFFSAAEAYNREKVKYLDKLLELQKEERDTAAKIAEYAVRLKTAGESKEITEATITSLFQAIGALKQISVVLRVSAMFWRQMGAHCKELASSDLKEKVTMFMTQPPDQRLVFFLDEDFKLQVVTYLAGWKAVEVIAIDYGVTCGKVRAQIQEDFVKNPNTEESRRLAPILGARLLEVANADLGENATQTRAIEAELASMRPAA